MRPVRATIDNRRSHAPAGLGDNDRVAATDGVRGEGHTGYVRENHFLNDHRHVNASVFYALGMAIGEGRFGPERGPAFFDHPNEAIWRDVVVGIVLSCKAGIGQIFSSRR